MNKINTFLLFLMVGFSAQAKTTIPVVKNYDSALDPAVWTQTLAHDVPESLVQNIEIEDPSMAFREPYADVFLQNTRMVVCFKDCEGEQNIVPQISENGKKISVTRISEERHHKTNHETNNTILRQTTVYYWVNKLFDRMAELGFVPEKRLIVRLDRAVKNPDNGIDFTNNAFFNDKDWSLSFLPEENGFLYSVLAGMTFRSPGFDPSVAMHEATHSIFEALIGPILNDEIYGLHEAFADYFSLTILNSPKLGTIMGSSKPLREADKLIEYKPKMEAHDLGNVVVAAMWNIRNAFTDKLEADRIALETIRTISRNTYASAGDIVQAYADSFVKFASAKSKSDEKLLDALSKIWLATKLAPTVTKVDLTPIKSRTGTKPFVISNFHVDVPEWVEKEFGDRDESFSLGILDLVTDSENKKSVWLKVAIDEVTTASTIWILFDTERKSIVAAYDNTFTAIDRTTSDTFRKLLIAGGSLGEMASWNNKLGADMIGLDDYKKMLKYGKDRVTTGFIQINGLIYPTRIHHKIVKRKLLAKIFGLLGNEIRAMTRLIRQVDFITIADDGSDMSKKLKTLVDGEKVVGYTIHMSTGMKKTILLEQIK